MKIAYRNVLLPFTLTVLLCSTFAALANKSPVTESNEPLVIADKFTFQSSILNEVRTFYVHLPTGYSNQSNTYPCTLYFRW